MSTVGFKQRSCFNLFSTASNIGYTDKILLLDVSIADFIENLQIFKQTKKNSF